jgi:hypothetical protein
MHHTAHLTQANYEACCEDLLTFLQKTADSKVHFAKFIDEWTSSFC